MFGCLNGKVAQLAEDDASYEEVNNLNVTSWWLLHSNDRRFTRLFMKCKTTIEIWDSFASSFIEVVMLGFLVYKGGSQILW